MSLAPRLALILALILALAGCAPAPAEEELVGRGNATPEGAVERFIEELNAALADPALARPEVRRSWAERLASRFTPSERADQRTALGQMLARFADSAARPAVGSAVRLEITYSGTDIISREGDEALVRVVDATVTLRWLDDDGEVLRERSGGLAELIGETRDGLSVLRVDGSWFMTEG